MNGGWKEVTIYVHGVTSSPDSHSDTYGNFHKMVNNEIDRLNKKKTGGNKPHLGQPIEIEWGWDNHGKNKGYDRYLAKAEENVTNNMWNAYGKTSNFTLNPSRLAITHFRDSFLNGFADMFYYVSAPGEETIRKTVFTQILDSLADSNSLIPDNISLTCIGHSAGTVILHDLLYNLFAKKYLSNPRGSSVFNILEDKEKELLQDVRNKAASGKIRLRRFYTLGSPITPLIFRSNDLLKKFAENNKGVLNLEDIGIEPAQGLKWVNFWDKDDVISYPLAFLYKNSDKSIKDKHINISISALKAHAGYWKSRNVARIVSETY